MIARVWSAQTTAERLPAYVDHLRRHVFPEIRSVVGCEGMTLLERPLGGLVEVIVITYWRSIDAVRGFAGDDVERAVVSPQAAALLTTFDERVRHYDVVLGEGGPLKLAAAGESR